MDINQEFWHLEQELGARDDMRQLQSDPHIELIKIQYGANNPSDATDFRILVVLKEGVQTTEKALRDLLPIEIELSSIHGNKFKLPVELMEKEKYEFRKGILPGTRGAYPIDQLPTDLIE